MKDALSTRMKDFYESITRYFLPKRTYTIIRVDGKAFHSYTAGLNRPFDDGLMEDMDETAKYLCKNIQGAKLAFVQSDEISILVTDFDNINTCPWFNGNIQKITSVSASMATAKFNQLRLFRDFSTAMTTLEFSPLDLLLEAKLAEFDSRVFTISFKSEVINYFIWRQQDTTRNSIFSVSQEYYSHNEVDGKNSFELQDMIFEKGVNWNDYSPRYKRGRIVLKTPSEDSDKFSWEISEPPIFTQEIDYLKNLIIPF